jgi:hypothetical protein
MFTLNDRTPTRRTVVVAIVGALVALLALGAVGPTGLAATPPISLTAKPDTVPSGGLVTLQIHLNGVHNATLNGQPLKGDKITEKVAVVQDTTFTVQALDKQNKPVTQSVTVHVATTPAPPAPAAVPAPTPVPLPDLWLFSLDYQEEAGPNPDQVTLKITARVGNIGTLKSDGFVTELYNGSQPVGSISMDPLSPNTSWMTTWTVTVPKGKFATFTATADPANRISELRKDNNSKSFLFGLSDKLRGSDLLKTLPLHPVP